MTVIILKVPQPIPSELDTIKQLEGLGNRTSTITFLVKYYFLTQKDILAQKLSLLDKLTRKIDVKKLPSAREQLADI